MINGKQLKNKGTKIMLDKERVLKFDLNAFCELEEIFGDIDNAFEALDRGSIKAIRALLYAALKSDDYSLTLEKVGEIISGVEGLEGITNTLLSAFTDSQPDPVSDIEVTNKKK